MQNIMEQETKAPVKLPPFELFEPNLRSARRPRAFTPSSMCSSSPTTVPREQQTIMHSGSLVPTVLTTPTPIVARPKATMSESVYFFFILLPKSMPIMPPTSTAMEFAKTPSMCAHPCEFFAALEYPKVKIKSTFC